MGKQLIDAAERGDVNVVEEALRCGVPVDSVDSRGYTALMCAAANGHLACAQVRESVVLVEPE